MEFKLTEEQSQDILKHFGSYREIIRLIHVEAYDVLDRYYRNYCKNHTGFFKPMKRERFFDRISQGNTNIHASTNTVVAGNKYVYSYNKARLSIKKLMYLKVHDEAIANQVVHAALDSPYIFGDKPNKVSKLYDNLVEYGSIPYVVDSEVLDLYRVVKKENLERIELLNLLGVSYEL